MIRFFLVLAATLASAIHSYANTNDESGNEIRSLLRLELNAADRIYYLGVRIRELQGERLKQKVLLPFAYPPPAPTLVGPRIIRDQILVFSNQLEPLKSEWKRLQLESAKNKTRIRALRSSSPDIAGAALGAIAWTERMNSRGLLSAPGTCDLRQEWPEGEKNQGPAGTCSLFAATALLEAAYFRAYDEHIVLSEGAIAREIIRASLAAKIEIALSGVKVRSTAKGILNGMKAGFLCRESTYRTPDGKFIPYFESSAIGVNHSPEENAIALKFRKDVFKKNFGADGSPAVLACRKEGAELSLKFKTFRSCSIDPKDIEKLLSLGIPAYASVPARSVTKDYTGSGFHAVVLQGHFNGYFPIRNSWGKDMNSRCEIRLPKPNGLPPLPPPPGHPVIPVTPNLLQTILTPADLELIRAKFPELIFSEALKCE